MIRAVFFDIDGTLIDHEHGSVVPRSTLDSLGAMRRKGIKLFVATGRIPSMLGPVRDIFPFDGFVTLNGQLVLDDRGNPLHRMAHRPEAIRALLKVLERDPFPALIIEEKESFQPFLTPVVEKHFGWLNLPAPPVYDPARLQEHPVLQFLAYIPWEQRDRLSPIPAIETTSAGGNILDVLPKGGGKEVGIAAAASHYGFSREEILVFGDGINDARMLRWAGTGVAMGNGVREAKETADYVTAPVGEDGVRQALLHFGVLSPQELP